MRFLILYYYAESIFIAELHTGMRAASLVAIQQRCRPLEGEQSGYK